MQEAGANMDVQDNMRRTPINYACALRQWDTVAYLAKLGNVNVKYDVGLVARRERWCSQVFPFTRRVKRVWVWVWC